MPNFRARTIDLKLPASKDEVEFLWASTPQNGCSLVLARINNQHSFVQVSQKADFYVCKIDKLSKLSDLASMQKMLLSFRDLFASDIIDEACALSSSQQLASNILTPQQLCEHIQTGKRVFVEIGFGSGRHLLARAKAQPADLFIGIEIHRPSLLQTSRLASAKQLDNIYLLDADARIVLDCLDDESLDGIYVHFPVPWPDAPGRRVISPQLRDIAARVLKPGAFVELRSDEEFYFDYAREVFSDWQQVCKKNADGFIMSKYEARWQRMGKDIFDLIAIKSAAIKSVSRFSGSKRFEPFCASARMVFAKDEGVFCKIARLYECPQGVLALAHFGAFDMPTSAYLLFRPDRECVLLSKAPSPSAANLRAWELLRRSLCTNQ